jgi:hypothetical protein
MIQSIIFWFRRVWHYLYWDKLSIEWFRYLSFMFTDLIILLCIFIAFQRAKWLILDWLLSFYNRVRNFEYDGSIHSASVEFFCIAIPRYFDYYLTLEFCGNSLLLITTLWETINDDEISFQWIILIISWILRFSISDHHQTLHEIAWDRMRSHEIAYVWR